MHCRPRRFNADMEHAIERGGLLKFARSVTRNNEEMAEAVLCGGLEPPHDPETGPPPVAQATTHPPSRAPSRAQLCGRTAPALAPQEPWRHLDSPQPTGAMQKRYNRAKRIAKRLHR